MAAEGITRELEEIVGKENVKTGSSSLAGYFEGPINGTGLILVSPLDEFDLSEVAQAASKTDTPIFSLRREKMPSSLAAKEGILIDFSRMDRIKLVDRRNLMARIFAGVTYEKLQEECLKNDCKLLLPAAATSRYVLRSYLDRDILNGNAVYRFPNLSIFHAILSDGRIWVSGAQQMVAEGVSDFREDQGPQFSLFFGASEDIFGLPYYGIVYVYPLRETRRVLLFGFNELEPAKDLAYKINREEHCFECVTANSRYLSALLSEKADEADKLREELPNWITAVSIEHHVELVDMWEKFVRDDAERYGGKPIEGDLVDRMDRKFQEPWYLFDRDYLRGGMKSIDHYDLYGRVPDLLWKVRDVAESKGYAAGEVGQLIVPVYFGASCYIESDLYYDPGDEAEAGKVEEIYLEAYKVLLDAATFVDRPTGELAKIVYDRVDEGYMKVLKTFKNIIDPKGTLNPNQLVEGV